MAPKRGESIERSNEYEAFIQELAAYHEKRGTTFEAEPKVGVRHVDLRALYKRVVDEGGYDLCSDTRQKPLCWRKFAEEFVGKNVYSAAQAFQMKQIYYKNLVAYEISEHWKQEPPPKEILEDVSAKGGNVMGRTLENFVKPPSKEESKLADSSPETPKLERMDAEDPGSAAGRQTRGLRHQPPQRVLFQPDANARQTRGQTSASSPGAMPNGFMNGLTNGASSTLASYEPSQSYPLSLKPVTTPANNPEHYRNDRKRKLEAMAAGTGFIGPNIYVRAQMALQSGIPDEERYALHHLVKISHERGDKYRFDQFPGLAEALARKVLCASSLFYDVTWDVDYEDDTLTTNDETLNGLVGTADLIKKLQARPLPIRHDSVLDGEFLDHMNRITEAGLVIRNMCTMDENAMYAASLPLVRDVIAITISLPQHSALSEIRNYMLEIAEMILKFCDVSTQEDLYSALLSQLKSKDRGTLILTMKVISRLSMTLPPPKQLEAVEPETLRNIQDWLLIEDEELQGACLDFLMQYTTFATNVETLLEAVDPDTLTRQLSRLLLSDTKPNHQSPMSTKQTSLSNLIPPVPRLSKSVVEPLLELKEPERSSEWLRMCFFADPSSEMTQISLWQAYQGTFGPYQATHGNLIAGEFIKNVSTVFAGATAQVAGQNKYVIRGIRSRKVPVETGLSVARPSDKGKELMKCLWKVEQQIMPADPADKPTMRLADCGEWFRRSAKEDTPTEPASDAMDLDGQPDLTNGNTTKENTAPTFDFAAADKTTHTCRWANCGRSSADIDAGKASLTALFARHIETHLPDASTLHHKHNIKREDILPAQVVPLHLSVPVDETGDAAGLSLTAALVLSHIARFMPGSAPVAKIDARTALGVEKEEPEESPEKLIEKVFGSEVKDRMFFVLAHCKPALHVNNILRNIRRSAG
ncbi:hypothetical protein AMS68_006936 [Peltaster fructicola]|uniref:ARID domain-containing protein n=1 Tax=Peltaster fructicola TaxID=286661 RepID=A0A6H0Y3J4_9PEZI|nr:hypothetical protein AMS68_006936 [Peltaster fructicola]